MFGTNEPYVLVDCTDSWIVYLDKNLLNVLFGYKINKSVRHLEFCYGLAYNLVYCFGLCFVVDNFVVGRLVIFWVLPFERR